MTATGRDTHVEVTLYATLRRYAQGQRTIDVPMEPGATVADVLDRLDIPAGQARIIFVEHRAATPETPLQPGDHLGIFPAIGGG